MAGTPGGREHYPWEVSSSEEAALFVQINTDNQIKSDADANARLEARIRSRLRRFERRLTHVELHVSDVNGGKGGNDKRVSLELRANGHAPLAVHADAQRVDDAVTVAAEKAVRALDHALGRLGDSKGH
jgi:hypothetical protein